MSEWTKLKAYIMRMNGLQTAALHRAYQERADAAYRAHLEYLKKKYGG